jgi:hypothetical protein
MKENPTVQDQLDMLYVRIMSDGMGNTMFSDDQTHYLKETLKCLLSKYGSEDYRSRFLVQCVLKSETNELDTEDREWVRYILHQESEPDEQHQRLLSQLQERMKNVQK